MSQDLLIAAKKPAPKKEEKAKNDKHPFSFLVILFSVFIAVILWFYVQDAEAPDYKKTFTNIPVEMQSLSASYSVISGGENRVDITLVGKRSDLNKIKASDLMAYLDLSDATQSGEYPIGVLVPEGMELFDCFPKAATLYIDQTISKSVPLDVEKGEYTVTGVELEYETAVEQIQIKGPKGVLDQVDRAQVKVGDLGEVYESFESNMDYKLLDKNGNEVTSRHIVMPEKNVLVTVRVIKKKSVPLTLSSKNGWWSESDMKYTISPQTVLIKGEPSAVDALESIDALVLDESTVDSSRYTTTLTPDKIVLPDGIRLAETVGDIEIDLTLQKNTARTLKMRLDSGHVAVTPPEKTGLSYTLQGTSLSFKIRGNYETINEAEVEDFYLNIDLSQITATGTVEVPVQIVQTSATEGKYYAVGSYTVKVLISDENGQNN